MKKFLSIVLTFVMIASLFTVTASAVEVGADLKPSFSVEIEKVVESTNKAWVNIYLSTSEDLDYAAATVEDEETGEEVTTYAGKSAQVVDVKIKLNADYLTVTKADVSFTSSAKYDSNDTTAVLDDLSLRYVHQGAATAGIVGNKVKLCRAMVPVNGTYTADELNAVANLFTLVEANVTISEYAAGTTDANAIAKQTNYSTNVGTADYDIVVAAPAPVDPVTVSGGTADKTGDKDDTKVWKVDVAGDKVAKGDELTATLAYNGETQIVPLTVNVEGGADWSFNLRVRFKDCASQDEMNAKRDATTLTVVKAAN